MDENVQENECTKRREGRAAGRRRWEDAPGDRLVKEMVGNHLEQSTTGLR